MNESLDFTAYIPYFLIVAYYVLMLRKWLPPPPFGGDETTGNEKAAAGRGGKPDGGILRQIATPLANDNQESRQPMTTASRATALERIQTADHRFDETNFLSGASRAFELVVNAYAHEDASILDELLDVETVGGFNRAIAERRKRGEKHSLTFIGIKKVEITDVEMEENLAEITVRFVSEMVSATYATDGTIVDGDPEQVVEVTDVWTFARCVSSSSPDWKLVATEGG